MTILVMAVDRDGNTHGSMIDANEGREFQDGMAEASEMCGGIQKMHHGDVQDINGKTIAVLR